MDVAAIIKALGGPSAIAQAVRAATGAPYSANSIHWWKYRGTIPAGVWPHLLRLAAERGVADVVTLDVLTGHWRPRRPRSAPAPAVPLSAEAA